MIAKWWTDLAAAFDTETTGVNPHIDRMVSAHLVEVSKDGARKLCSKLINPGVPIPAEATAIHGIDDVVASTGFAPFEAITEIAAGLKTVWRDGLPVVICNAPFDLTLLRAEMRRLGMPTIDIGPVLDPLVIDRGNDRYRKGSRRLDALALHYGVRQDAAHSAEGDALCAARIVWAQSRRFNLDLSLSEMQRWQSEAHSEWAAGYEKHLRDKGNAKARIDAAWPIGSIT